MPSGSTGGIGRAVIQTLLSEKLIPVTQLRISSYNTAAIPITVRDTGIEIRKGNMYEISTLVESYASADTLFLVSFPSMGEERYVLHRNAIDAAKTAGVGISFIPLSHSVAVLRVIQVLRRWLKPTSEQKST